MGKIIIFFSTDSLRRGGKERQLMLLYSGLRNDKYEKYIVTQDFTDNNYLDEFDIDTRQIILIRSFSKYSELIKEKKPDLIFTWDTKSSLYALFLSIFYKYKFINGSIRHGIRLLKLSHLLRSIILWFSPYIIANSESGLYANNLRLKKSRYILYNGIDAGKFSKMNLRDKNENILKYFPEYNQENSLVFISIANLVPYKDYFTVISALNKVRDKLNFNYFIIGDGPLYDEIKENVISLKLSEKIFFTGRVENIESFLQLSDILIHSSRGEGISNAILEGMYSGLPIIASKVGGIPETIYPSSTLLFNYKDVQGLYECLLKANELKLNFNPDSEGYIQHLEKFSLDKMNSRFEEILDEILRSPK